MRREGSSDLKPDFLRVAGDDGFDVVDCVVVPGMSDGFREVEGDGVAEALVLEAIMVCVDITVKHASNRWLRGTSSSSCLNSSRK